MRYIKIFSDEEKMNKYLGGAVQYPCSIFLENGEPGKRARFYKSEEENPNKFTLEEIDREKFLWKVTYQNYDIVEAEKYFRKKYKPAGGCSSVRNGNFFGRNFDWYYDNEVTFVISVPRIDGADGEKPKRYASIGIAGCLPSLTRDAVENMTENLEIFSYLPFATLDAMNECGLTVNINVVPWNDGKGITTGTRPEAEESLCMMMLPRFIVDNFSSAKEAAEYIRDNVNVYSVDGDIMQEEIHAMVADAESTYLIEFINNECQVTDITGKPYMTNFHVFETTPNADGTVCTPYTVTKDGKKATETNGITPHGMGLERYNHIVRNYEGTDTLDGMSRLMRHGLRYSQAYDEPEGKEDKIWYTEMVMDSKVYGNVTVDTPYDSKGFEGIGGIMREWFKNRERTEDRSHGTWQTVHTTVYDMENKKMYLSVQEEDGEAMVFDL